MPHAAGPSHLVSGSTVVAEESIDEVPCYRIRALHPGLGECEIWIGVIDNLLRKLRFKTPSFTTEEVHRTIEMNKNIPEKDFLLKHQSSP